MHKIATPRALQAALQQILRQVGEPNPSRRQIAAALHCLAIEVKGRFEEGKPADPTENMSQEDAEEWRDMNEEHRDNFKTAAASTPQEKKLPNGWVLKWNPQRPDRMSVDDEGEGSWSDEALLTRGKILYDFPERIPAVVRNAVKSFFRKVRSGKTAGLHGIHADEIAKSAFTAASVLFDARADFRGFVNMLQDVYEDMSGLGPDMTHEWREKHIKTNRDLLHKLDQEMGDVARSLETLGREVKKLPKGQTLVNDYGGRMPRSATSRVARDADSVDLGRKAAVELAHRWHDMGIEPVKAAKAIKDALEEAPSDVTGDDVALDAFKRHLPRELDKLKLLKH